MNLAAARILVSLLILAALAGWALWERQGRLGCEVARVQLADAYAVLADKVKQQNDAVQDLARKAATAREAGRQAQIAAEAAAKAKDAEIIDLRARLAAPAPPGQDCRDVWTAIRKSLTGAP